MTTVAQVIVAALAAVVLTATAVGAAVGPAQSVAALPVSLVAHDVSGQAHA